MTDLTSHPLYVTSIDEIVSELQHGVLFRLYGIHDGGKPA